MPREPLRARVNKGNEHDIFSDSDWAGDRAILSHNTRSQSGTVIRLNGAPAVWKSQKQPVTTDSSAAAEIWALAQTVREAQHFQTRAHDLGINVPNPMQIQVDATGALSFQGRTCQHSKLRGVFELKEAIWHELRDKQRIEAVKVPGEDNLADLLTKCLHSGVFTNLVRKSLKWAR